MKKNTPFEIILLVIGFGCFITAVLTKDPETNIKLRSGLYLFTALAVSMKIFRFAPMLTSKTKWLSILGNALMYLAVLAALFLSKQELNFLWLIGILLFSVTSAKEINRIAT
jgi:hypothetical protein